MKLQKRFASLLDGLQYSLADRSHPFYHAVGTRHDALVRCFAYSTQRYVYKCEGVQNLTYRGSYFAASGPWKQQVRKINRKAIFKSSYNLGPIIPDLD